VTRLLLDTHLLLWWLTDDPRLPADLVDRVMAPAVAELERDGDHRDPFDRLLVCQSGVEPMLFLTPTGSLSGTDQP
jgi:PIN domain nuclease of toxin-antitoxin system